MLTIKKLAVCCAVPLLLVSIAEAKVSPQEAEKLKNNLTPMGAEKAGNAEGSIPPYTGDILGAPKWVDYKGTGTHYPDSYPDEKPLFSITYGNYKRFEDKLSDGTIELFKRYPDSFKMKIYTSHRDARYSDAVHKNTFLNATRSVLTADGNGITDTYGGAPFPIPQNGVEVVFNHGTAQFPYNFEADFDEFAVYEDGNVAKESTYTARYLPMYDPQLGIDGYSKQGNIAALIFTKWDFPTRKKGEMVLVNENLDYTNSPRQAWVYIPGTRRVRRAPTVGYDTPDGTGGLRTVDDFLLFNGAVDRFNWVLEGKKEMYVPYHNYGLDSTKLTYDDIIQPKHLNPEYLRYELHRVWVVTGTLKADARHIYGKRRLYIDEDSWNALYADNYDGKGNLWRANMKTCVNAYDMPGITGRVMIFRDLQVNAYMVSNLINEKQSSPRIPDNVYDRNFFTPSSLRKMGTK